MEELFLGIDIGGTNTKFGFITKEGDVLLAQKIRTNSDINFKDYVRELKAQVDDVFKSYKDKYILKAIGVGAPNANGKNGCIENPPNLKWNTVDLVKDFEAVFNLPVKLENDANIAAVGEKVFGLAQRNENFIVVTLGTGVGTGVFINNELYLGSHGIGSEAGHLTIEPNGDPCSCGGLGHLESYASATGIKRMAKETFDEEIRFREIIDRYHSGDKEIIKLIDKTSYYLALGLASISSLLSPQRIILTGGVTVLGEKFRKSVEKEFSKLVYQPFKNNTEIMISEISAKEGAILGAAALVIKKAHI